MRWSTLILVSLVACSKPSEEAKPESKPIEPMKIPDPSAPTPGAAARTSPTRNPTPTTDVRALMGKMEVEAAKRPKAGVLAEPLFDALEDKVGIKLDSRRQYVGETMKASFCAGGYTEDHVTIAMCEYPDDKAAQASLEYMNKYFPVSKGGRRMHHAAVMTIITPTATDPRIDKAITTFESL